MSFRSSLAAVRDKAEAENHRATADPDPRKGSLILLLGSLISPPYPAPQQPTCSGPVSRGCGPGFIGDAFEEVLSGINCKTLHAACSFLTQLVQGNPCSRPGAMGRLAELVLQPLPVKLIRHIQYFFFFGREPCVYF